MTELEEDEVAARALEPCGGRERDGGPSREPLERAVAGLGDHILSGRVSLDEAEDGLLRYLVASSGGSVPEASRRSGIPKDRFYRRLKKG